jgi:hypothetical protein
MGEGRRRNTIARAWEIRRYAAQKVILHCVHHHGAEIIKTAMPRLWLPVLVFLAMAASSSQAPSSTDEIKSPDLNLVMQRLEKVQHQDPARSERPLPAGQGRRLKSRRQPERGSGT